MSKHVMCPECAVLRPEDEVKTTACPWCGYDPNISARERRFRRRLSRRQKGLT